MAGLGRLDALGEGSALQKYFEDQLDAGLTWQVVEWLRGITSLPVLVKGVLTAEDAMLASKSGASGLIISNHGGRQLD